MNKQSFKKALIITHDLVATALAVIMTFVLRFDGELLFERVRLLPLLLPPFVAFAGLIYWYFALYQSKWRFASLPDLSNIFRATTVCAISLLVLDYILVSPHFYGFYFFGKTAIALYWVLQMFLLGGPRLAFRYLKYSRSRKTIAREATMPTLVIGKAGDVEVLLRAIESGAVKKVDPRGILSPREDDHGARIRSVPVLGSFADLELVVQDLAERGTPVRRLIATPSALVPEAHPEDLIARARRLGLPLARVTSLGENMHDAEIAPLEIEDLLLRPTIEIDRERLESFVRGKRILVTGGGGSIGSEICTRVAAFGASELMIVESSEPALHNVLESRPLVSAQTKVAGVIADVRDRMRIREVMREFSPDLVFHAAALKQVPFLERDWSEAIKTNIFGSVHVADEAARCGASAMVMISTDKAIEPVSMLGATKRFAEMYVQALDAERRGNMNATRLIAVRFGNVLGSVGSVVPKFKAQIAHGGPVTVTHPDMVRYFMTVREACDLVLTAASHADVDVRRAPDFGEAAPIAVYVLKMGQPVRIMELAERMIRFAGFEPGEDIEIAVTGQRPGERLHEILFAREEPPAETGIDGVMAAGAAVTERSQIEAWLVALSEALEAHDRAAAERILAAAIPGFRQPAPAAPPARMPLPAPPARSVARSAEPIPGE